jgi:UDP-2-acetamido-2-deoxy-ribo-hexuluronate aminotransferase
MIPYLDLTQSYKRIQKVAEPEILNILSSGQYILGKPVEECEASLAQFVGSKHALAVSNGTIALMMALQAIDVGPGDEVIVPSFSFFATAEVVSTLGAHPIFIDVDRKNCNIRVDQIEKAITKKTKAIMPVSLYGQMPDMDEIMQIAEKHGLYVIEDAAQSFGATYKGKRSCSVSHIGCTSFFPAKPLGCAGDGGAVFTSDSVLAKKLDAIRVHGQTRRYYHEYIGVNGRLDPIQCIVIKEKLKFYNEDIKERQAIAKKYNDSFKNLDLMIPEVKSDRESVYAQYTLIIPRREEFIDKLQKMGVPTSIHYPMGMHEQPIYKNLNVSLPTTEDISKKVVSLPLYPGMPDKDIQTVIEAVHQALS